MTTMEERARILCVDDEKNVLRAIERLFVDESYEILAATSGEEGLETLSRLSPIPVVISDYRMPAMNGVDFLREVRKRWPDTVRIVLSGYADTAAVVEAINEGQIYKFIPKPWNDDELRVTIANALDRYYLYRKNVQLTEELKRTNEQISALNESLERLVEERVSELLMRNNMLECARDVLDALPVAVLGTDEDGAVILCNGRALELFLGDKGTVLGMDRRDCLPSYLNQVIEKILTKKKFSGHLSIGSRTAIARGVTMVYPDGQEGVVLVFDWERRRG